MAEKFSYELSIICGIIISLTLLLKLCSYKFPECKVYMVILDCYFAIVSTLIMINYIIPSLNPIPENQFKRSNSFNWIDFEDSERYGSFSGNSSRASSCCSGLKFEIIKSTSLSPVAATFSNYIDSYIYLNDVLFVYYRPTLLVHVVRQLVIIYYFTSIFSGYLYYEHLIAGFQLTCALLIYLYIDISLQNSDECSRRKDVQVMKTIHDLKNPVIAIRQTLEDEDYDSNKDEVQKIISAELFELEDMLESLRTEFKSRHQMEIKETPNHVDALEFASQFERAFKKLAQNGGNSLCILSENVFPISICIQRSNVKRIVNNLISNALKHTMDGHVKVVLKVVENQDIKAILSTIQNNQDTYLEPKIFSFKDLLKIENYIMVQVIDNGSGISKEKLPQIFAEKYSDELDSNWDGMGLGLPICKYICTKINAFIVYKSNPKVETVFQFYIPNYNSNCLSNAIMETPNPALIKKISINLKVNLLEPIENEHFCDCAYVAEDNPNILSKYVKIFKKNNIPHKTFDNGKKLYQYLRNLACSKCQNILVYTDLNMPYMSGKVLAQELRKIELSNYNRIKIVLISAEEYDNSNNLFDEVFYKPIIPSKLASVYNNFYSYRHVMNEYNKTNSILLPPYENNNIQKENSELNVSLLKKD